MTANHAFQIAPIRRQQPRFGRLRDWLSMWKKIALAEFLCSFGPRVE